MAKNNFSIEDILARGFQIYLMKQEVKPKPTREEYEQKIKSLEKRIKELENKS